MLKFSREADDGGMGKTKQNNVVYVEFIRERAPPCRFFFWEEGAEVHRLKVRGESFIHRVSYTGA